MNTNALALIGLSTEYCTALEATIEAAAPRDEFVDTMLRLLPRLYITASDLRDNLSQDAPVALSEEEAYGEGDGGAMRSGALDEDYYEAVRRGVEALMEEDDVYLEVFEEDMKYSDTPVSASIAEGLADIFQPLYNLITTVHPGATDETVDEALRAVTDDFAEYWSERLCNVLRALNHLKYRA